MALEPYKGWNPAYKEKHPAPIPALPRLSEVLPEFGPVGNEALFLGVANDSLPVLLNLHDPVPGPLLIAGDPGSGKTALLKTIAHASGMMHAPEAVQFGVLTSHPDEWSSTKNIANNVGVFSINHRSSGDFILSLASWAHGNKSSKQSVVLLMDDLGAAANMDVDTVQNLRWLLLRGPQSRVWPIVTLGTQGLDNMVSWLPAFRTRIMGNVMNTRDAIKLDKENKASLNTLQRGSEFTLREGSQWLRFWVPAPDQDE